MFLNSKATISLMLWWPQLEAIDLWSQLHHLYGRKVGSLMGPATASECGMPWQSVVARLVLCDLVVSTFFWVVLGPCMACPVTWRTASAVTGGSSTRCMIIAAVTISIRMHIRGWNKLNQSRRSFWTSWFLAWGCPPVGIMWFSNLSLWFERRPSTWSHSLVNAGPIVTIQDVKSKAIKVGQLNQPTCRRRLSYFTIAMCQSSRWLGLG